MKLVPYIMFNGNCEEALNFYASALNGSIKNLMRYEGTPGESMTDNKQKIMHANFSAGGFEIMASDTGNGGPETTGNGPVHLSLDFKTADEEQKVFDELSQGGKVTMPLQDTFWGAKFGMLKDKYGINWMFNCDVQASNK